MNEKKLIEKLQNGDESDVYKLYTYRPIIVKWVQKNNGTEEEGQDLFQEALFVFVKNVKSGKYHHDSKISTYLMGICKNQWYKKLRDNREHHSDNLQDNEKIEENDDGPNELSLKSYVKALMEGLSESCRKLVTARFYENAIWEKDYLRLGYTSSQSARQQFSVCLSKLRGNTSYDELLALD